MKTFHCNRCNNLVFFENVQCESCGALLGYVPELGEISAFEPSAAASIDTGDPAAAQDAAIQNATDGNAIAPTAEPAAPAAPEAIVVADAAGAVGAAAVIGDVGTAGETAPTTPAAAPTENATVAPAADTANAPAPAAPPVAAPAAPLWTSLHPDAQGKLFRQCHNYAVENVCNWMIPADSDATLCRACQLTRTIPNLDSPTNRTYWYRLETAKRRLLYTLFALGLPVESRAEDPEHGLQFDFLEDTPDGTQVMTGHADGVVTLNVAEADDAHREKTRSELGEPYRTLLGHFRHEVGHYYFDVLVANTHWLEPYRELFGDERADYGESLTRHYEQGAPADWAQRHVSSYATMHPWEDWAETWAHYLHMVDTLDTAASCGLALVPETPHEPTLTDQTPVEEASFDNLMKRWFPLTYVLNSLNRSLGMQDGYPFALAPPVVDKLRFVHRVVTHAGVKG